MRWKVRFMVLLFLLLIGCSSRSLDSTELITDEPDDRIRITPGVHTEHWNNDTAEMYDEISFTIENIGDVTVQCSIELRYRNDTTENKTIKYVGLLKALEVREESFLFKMPDGDAKFSITPLCV